MGAAAGYSFGEYEIEIGYTSIPIDLAGNNYMYDPTYGGYRPTSDESNWGGVSLLVRRHWTF
jgi:hypothetical protein